MNVCITSQLNLPCSNKIHAIMVIEEVEGARADCETSRSEEPWQAHFERYYSFILNKVNFVLSETGENYNRIVSKVFPMVL